MSRPGPRRTAEGRATGRGEACGARRCRRGAGPGRGGRDSWRGGLDVRGALLSGRDLSGRDEPRGGRRPLGPRPRAFPPRGAAERGSVRGWKSRSHPVSVGLAVTRRGFTARGAFTARSSRGGGDLRSGSPPRPRSAPESVGRAGVRGVVLREEVPPLPSGQSQRVAVRLAPRPRGLARRRLAPRVPSATRSLSSSPRRGRSPARAARRTGSARRPSRATPRSRAVRRSGGSRLERAQVAGGPRPRLLRDPKPRPLHDTGVDPPLREVARGQVAPPGEAPAGPMRSGPTRAAVASVAEAHHRPIAVAQRAPAHVVAAHGPTKPTPGPRRGRASSTSPGPPRSPSGRSATTAQPHGS